VCCSVLQCVAVCCSAESCRHSVAYWHLINILQKSVLMVIDFIFQFGSELTFENAYRLHTCPSRRRPAVNNTQSHTCIYAHTHARTHTDTHVHACARTHRHTNMYARTHTHTHAHTHTRTHTCIHAHTHTHTHTRTHTHAYTNTNTCVRERERENGERGTRAGSMYAHACAHKRTHGANR